METLNTRTAIGGLNRKTVGACCVLIVCWFFPQQSLAGAWTQEAGHGQIILTSSFFQTSRSFDPSGKPLPFGDKGSFQQVTLNPYLELGIHSRYSLVLNASAPWLEYSNRYGAERSLGLGDVEVGLKRRLNAAESAWAVAGQLTVMFPAYPASRNPAPGNHQEDVEGRFMVGRGGTCKGRHVFWDAEAAYRYRSGAPADQVRSDFTTGMDITRRVMLMGQFIGIRGLRNGDTRSVLSNPNAQSDFDLYKAQLSVVTAVTHGTRIQLGWNDAFAGRNTGRGQSAILAVWKSF